MADPVDIDFQAVTPEEAERLRRLGVRLPTASAASVDPSKAADYIDNRLTAVGFDIYLVATCRKPQSSVARVAIMTGHAHHDRSSPRAINPQSLH
jgi:hypothetical protein